MGRRLLTPGWIWAGMMAFSAILMGMDESKSMLIRNKILAQVSPVLFAAKSLSDGLRPSKATPLSRNVPQQISTADSTDPSAIQERNYYLRSEITRLRSEIQRLRSMFADSAPPAGVQARGIEGQVFLRKNLLGEPVVWLNKGVNHGVWKNAGVLYRGAVLGRVMEAESQSACVALLTDPKLSISVRLMNSRSDGNMTGMGSLARTCCARFVARELKILAGEMVVTSGLDGTFPAGCPVGRVAAIRQTEAMEWEVEIVPEYGYGTPESVFIVTSQPFEERADESAGR